jgi:hypothetical protein
VLLFKKAKNILRYRIVGAGKMCLCNENGALFTLKFTGKHGGCAGGDKRPQHHGTSWQITLSSIEKGKKAPG